MATRALAALLAALGPWAAGAQVCPAGSQPLLWELQFGEQKAFLLAGHSGEVERAKPTGVVQQVAECADMGFFSYACTPGAFGGLENFYNHCKEYPASDSKDAIALRLSSGEVAQLQSALRLVAADAPAPCALAAQNLQDIAMNLTSPNFRQSLRYVYLQALATLDSEKCTTDHFSQTAHTATGGGFEGWLREEFTNSDRPIYGLLNIRDNCKSIQSSSVEQDTNLVTMMLTHFPDPAWRASIEQQQSVLHEAVACGNLTQLASMWQRLHVNILGHLNTDLAKGIQFAMNDEPEKTLLFVVPVPHFVETMSIQSLQTILGNWGYSLTRMSNQLINCPKSTFHGPGAKQLDLCFTPPLHNEPTSCTDFNKAFQDYVKADPMQGRISDSSACDNCFPSNEACTCTTKWRNVTYFDRLCRSFQAGGVYGQLLAIDFTRNPGSHHTTVGLSEKTEKIGELNCYGQTCTTSLLETVATNKWYAKDPNLQNGLVTMYPYFWGKGKSSPWDVFHSPVFLAGVAILTLLCIGFLCAAFLMRRPRRKQKLPAHQEQQPLHEPSFTELAPADHRSQRARELYPPPNSVYGGNLRTAPFPSPDKFGPDGQPVESQSSRVAYDSTLLQSVMNARQELEGAGAQAVQNMQMQTLQGMNMQALGTGGVPPTSPGGGPMGTAGAQAYGSGFVPQTSLGFGGVPPTSPGGAYGSGFVPQTSTGVGGVPPTSPGGAYGGGFVPQTSAARLPVGTAGAMPGSPQMMPPMSAPGFASQAAAYNAQQPLFGSLPQTSQPQGYYYQHPQAQTMPVPPQTSSPTYGSYTQLPQGGLGY